MQPQSAQNINMYVPQSAANNAGIIRANQPNYRPSHTPSSPAPRNRFMANPMYLPPIQNVVPTQYPYQTRQTPYIPQYMTHGAPAQAQYYSIYPYYVHQQQQHQRTISVQPSVPSVSNGSGGVNGNTIIPGAMVGGVLQSAHPATPTAGSTTTTKKPRKHALKIIHPDTKRNIFDDIKIEKNTSSTDGEFHEQSTTTTHLETSQIKTDNSQINNGFPPDLRKYETSDNIVSNNQTPVVSAISNAPSVEIYTQIKTKTKKLQKDKEVTEKFRTSKCDESINQQQPPINEVECTDSVHEIKYLNEPNEVPQVTSIESIKLETSKDNNCHIYSECIVEEEKVDNSQEKQICAEPDEKVECVPLTYDVQSIDVGDVVDKVASKLNIGTETPINTADNASTESNELIEESLDNNCTTSNEYDICNPNENSTNINGIENSTEAKIITEDVNANVAIDSSSNNIQHNTQEENRGPISVRYDRRQLLQLRDVEASRVQPNIKYSSILPGINLMPAFANKKFPLGLISGSRSGDGSITQKYSYKESPLYGPNYSHGGVRGDVIRVNLLLNQNVELNESNNAWRPRILKKGHSANVNDPKIKAQQEKEDVIRKVRGILNKLTPEKFDTLLKEVMQLPIDTMEKLDAVMILVFEKAIDEPNFSVCYAELCSRLIAEVAPKDERSETEDKQNNNNKSKENGPGKSKSNFSQFRNSLLDKAQHEFSCNVINADTKEKKLEPLKEKIRNCEDSTEKVELKALLEEEERKIRRRSGGTVRFIGELFKLNILPPKSIVSYIRNLIEKRDNQDMLECLCKLLTTVGKKIDQTKTDKPNVYQILENTIENMQIIASKTNNPKISSRVRFMLQDVIDLRKNKWQTSRNETPTTMDQIEKEVHTQKMAANYLNYGLSGSNVTGTSSNSGGHGKRENRYNDNRTTYNGSVSQRGERGRTFGNDGGNIGSGSHNNNSSNDGGMWYTQTGKNSRSLIFDSNKLEAMNMTEKMKNGKMQMGNASQFQWGNISNPFAPLSTLDSNKGSSNDVDRDRNRILPRNKNSFNKGSMEHNRYNERDKATSSRSNNSQIMRENLPPKSSQTSRNVDTQKTTSQVKSNIMQSGYSFATPSEKSSIKQSSGGSIDRLARNDEKVSDLRGPEKSDKATTSASEKPNEADVPICFEKPSDSDLEKFKALASELVENVMHVVYLSEDYDYAVVSCIEGLTQSQLCGFMHYILTEYLHFAEVGSLHRRHLSNCVLYLLEHNYLTADHILLAYMDFSEIANDMMVDIPDLWLYVFEFIGPLIERNFINIEDLWLKKFESFETKFRKSFLKDFLQSMKRDIGPNYTKEFWKNHNFKWTNFISESEIDDFIKANKFEYIENDKIQHEVLIKESTEKLYRRVFDRIKQLLKEGTTADKVHDYLNGNIAEADRIFIRHLTTTLTKHCIKCQSNSHKLDVTCFQKVCLPVILRYINNNEDLELECLYALQILDYELEHPRDLLRDLFVQLNDNDIIPRETFLRWRDSTEHSVGKGVAVKALNPFFNQVLNGEASD